MTEACNLDNDQLAIHSTFTIERFFEQSPSRVFEAFADQAQVRRWRVEGEGWNIHEFTYDFRVGGAELSRFSYQDGPEIRLDAQFQDIVPDRRIVNVYRMAIGPVPLSVSLTTIELTPSVDGTLLCQTEQGVYFDSPDSPRNREEGCRGLLDALAEELRRKVPA